MRSRGRRLPRRSRGGRRATGAPARGHAAGARSRRRRPAARRRRLAVTPARLVLVDKSAYVRGAEVPGDDAELCLCAVTRLELLYSARSPGDYDQLEVDLAAFRELRMDAETFAIAGGAQREL